MFCIKLKYVKFYFLCLNIKNKIGQKVEAFNAAYFSEYLLGRIPLRFLYITAVATKGIP